MVTTLKRAKPHDYLATPQARAVADLLTRADRLRHDIQEFVGSDGAEDVLLGLMVRSNIDDRDLTPTFVAEVLTAMTALAFNLMAFRLVVSSDLASGPWFDATECRD